MADGLSAWLKFLTKVGGVDYYKAMEIKTASEIGRLGALATNRKYRKMKAKWGRKGAKVRFLKAKRRNPQPVDN